MWERVGGESEFGHLLVLRRGIQLQKLPSSWIQTTSKRRKEPEKMKVWGKRVDGVYFFVFSFLSRGWDWSLIFLSPLPLIPPLISCSFSLPDDCVWRCMLPTVFLHIPWFLDSRFVSKDSPDPLLHQDFCLFIAKTASQMNPPQQMECLRSNDERVYAGAHDQSSWTALIFSHPDPFAGEGKIKH